MWKTGGMQSSAHQGLEVCQVDVAVLVHLHHLNLHASHLSTRWVGAMSRLGDKTDLECKETILMKQYDVVAYL